MSKLLVIDGNNLAHRAKHVFSLTSQGEDVSVLYGFLYVLISYIKKFEPTSVFVAWDGGIPKYRVTLVPEYKANRVRGKDDPLAYEIFRDQLNMLHDVLPFLGVISCRNYGSEADDLIYHVTRIANVKSAIVVSNDKDLLQTITDVTSVYVPSVKDGGRLVTKENLSSVIPVKKRNYINWRALQGDSSDNIPGVRMVGESTATKLLSEFDSITSIIAAVNDGRLTGKVADNIREFGIDRIYKNIDVMALYKDLTGAKFAIKQSVDSWVPFSKVLTKKLFMKYAFVSMMNSETYKLFMNLSSISLLNERFPLLCERRSPVET